LVEVADFFVSDVISEVIFGPFWLMLPDQGPNRQTKVFRKNFRWKLSSSQQKKCTPKAKNFFRVQTRRLAASFHTSTKSVTCTGAEIFLHKAMCV